MRHGGFLRTSHERRRRSSTVTVNSPPPADGMTYLSAGSGPYHRRSSTSSLHELGAPVPTERRLSGSNTLTSSPAGSRQGSGCLTVPSTIRRRSYSERPPLVKRFSTMNFELKQWRVVATIFIICSCCVLVAVISYVMRHYMDLDF